MAKKFDICNHCIFYAKDVKLCRKDHSEYVYEYSQNTNSNKKACDNFENLYNLNVNTFESLYSDVNGITRKRKQLLRFWINRKTGLVEKIDVYEK